MPQDFAGGAGRGARRSPPRTATRTTRARRSITVAAGLAPLAAEGHDHAARITNTFGDRLRLRDADDHALGHRRLQRARCRWAARATVRQRALARSERHDRSATQLQGRQHAQLLGERRTARRRARQQRRPLRGPGLHVASTATARGAGRGCDHSGVDQPGRVSTAKPATSSGARSTTQAPGNVDVQLYDPAYVNAGDYCENGSLAGVGRTPSAAATTPNPYVTDARTRYALRRPDHDASSTGSYCTGDGAVRLQPRHRPSRRSRCLGTTDTGDPCQTPIHRRVHASRQWRDLDVDLSTSTSTAARPSASSIDRRRATPQMPRLPPVDDAELHALGAGHRARATTTSQVRTNIRDGARQQRRAGRTPATTPASTGQGANRFAIRAVVSGNRDCGVARLASSACRSSPTEPSNPAPTFNLVRVLPGAAGKCIKFTFFDVGDVAPTARTVHGDGADRRRPAPADQPVDRQRFDVHRHELRARPETLANVPRAASGHRPGNGQVVHDQRPDPDRLRVQRPTRSERLLVTACTRTSFPPGTALTDTTTWTRHARGRPGPPRAVAPPRSPRRRRPAYDGVR